MDFSCYSNNEKMGHCEKQCDFCKVYFHSLPKLVKHYDIKISGTNDQSAIKVFIPNNVLKDLRALKTKDNRAFNLALIELLNQKI